MRYNDRVELIATKIVNGEMGQEKRDVSLGTFECRITGASRETIMLVFGKYQSDVVTVHLKGKVAGVEYVIINGVKRTPSAVLQARNNTVIVISGV